MLYFQLGITGFANRLICPTAAGAPRPSDSYRSIGDRPLRFFRQRSVTILPRLSLKIDCPTPADPVSPPPDGISVAVTSGRSTAVGASPTSHDRGSTPSGLPYRGQPPPSSRPRPPYRHTPTDRRAVPPDADFRAPFGCSGGGVDGGDGHRDLRGFCRGVNDFSDPVTSGAQGALSGLSSGRAEILAGLSLPFAFSADSMNVQIWPTRPETATCLAFFTDKLVPRAKQIDFGCLPSVRNNGASRTPRQTILYR